MYINIYSHVNDDSHKVWHTQPTRCMAPKLPQECMEMCYSLEPLTQSLFIEFSSCCRHPQLSIVYVGYWQSEINILSNPQSGEKTHTCKNTNEWYFCIFFVTFWADSPNSIIVCKRKNENELRSQNEKKN